MWLGYHVTSIRIVFDSFTMMRLWWKRPHPAQSEFLKSTINDTVHWLDAWASRRVKLTPYVGSIVTCCVHHSNRILFDTYAGSHSCLQELFQLQKRTAHPRPGRLEVVTPVSPRPAYRRIRISSNVTPMELTIALDRFLASCSLYPAEAEDPAPATSCHNYNTRSRPLPT